MKGWEKRRNNWDVDTSLMSWCPGVVPALSVIVKLFSEDGDKVMIQTPVYSEFYDVTEAWGREVVENKLCSPTIRWELSGAARSWSVWPESASTTACCWCPTRSTRLNFPRKEAHSHRQHKRGACRKGDQLRVRHEDLQPGGITGLHHHFPELRDEAEVRPFLDEHGYPPETTRSVPVAMEAAYNEGEEWLEQLLEYLDGNFSFIRDYCEKYIPKIKPNVPDATYLVGWTAGAGNGQRGA